MGYHLHITRKDNWYEADGKKNISIDEWIRYVSGDKEMRLKNLNDLSIEQDEVFKYKNPGIAAWVANDPWELNTNKAWFNFHFGNIIVKNPDASVIEKMKVVARCLNAKVQGDDGEEYLSFNAANITDKKPWWKFWTKQFAPKQITSIAV